MIWVPTGDLIYKITEHVPRGVVDGDWDLKRVVLATTHKHRSVFQRYVEGRAWEDTDVFTDLYVERFRPHESEQGRKDYAAKLARYRTTLEAAFQNISRVGFRPEFDLPVVLIGREGEVMLWNQGNHRVAMAKVLKIKAVPCVVRTRHTQWQRQREQSGMLGHPDYL
jgi:hypothetical protein